MNSTNSSTPINEDIISERLLFSMAVTFRVCVNSVLALSSFVTNIINALVFKKMGLDRSTESFFILSIADCLTGFFGIFGGLSNGYLYLGPPYIALSMHSINIFALVPATVSSLISMVCTTVIAMVRCCSVVLPFQVRTIFTARRQRIFILFCTATTLVFVSYGLYGTRVVIRTHPKTHLSYLAIAFHAQYVERNRFADFYRGILFYTCFFTVSICLVMLFIALQRSFHFRTLSQTLEKNRSGEKDSRNQDDLQTSNEVKKLKLGGKETQIVKVVVLLSAVFAICNLPVMVIATLRQAVPGMNNIGKLKRSYDLARIVTEFFQLLNATINIVVYLKFNTRYYTAFLKVMKKN